MVPAIIMVKRCSLGTLIARVATVVSSLPLKKLISSFLSISGIVGWYGVDSPKFNEGSL